MRTLSEVLRLSKKILEGKKVVQSRKMAEEIIAGVLKMSRMDLYLNFDKHIREYEWRTCLQLLERKLEGEPLEYILQDISFYSCRLKITPSVLIPRQETEILLHKTCQTIGKKSEGIAWDLCCGSGCLGLGLKKALPHLDVSLSDISSKCIQVAKQNAVLNHLDVSFYEGDFLSPLEGLKADFILCNPPYISEAEFSALDRSVSHFEPYKALVSGKTGFEFYERLSSELPAFLNPGAKIFLEIGTNQGEKVLEIFHQNYWKSRRYEKDWSGHDRFFFLEIE